MSADTVQHQNQNTVIDFIYEQPVGFDMTFSAAFVISRQFMVVKS